MSFVKVKVAQSSLTLRPHGLYSLWNSPGQILEWVQFSSVVSNSAIPWTSTLQASLSITNSQSLLKLMSIESVMPSNHLILCRPLLFPPSIFPSIRVFSNKSVLRIRCPKYRSFSISPYNEYSGLISFRMDWLDRLALEWVAFPFSRGSFQPRSPALQGDALI